MTSDDFIDGDPFDPEVVIKAENAAHEDVSDEDEKVKQYLARRQRAYKEVFGNADEDALAFVMADLAVFCRAYRPTFHRDNQKLQDLLEGRREVFLRIMEHTRLSHDTLYTMYTDAYSQQRDR